MERANTEMRVNEAVIREVETGVRRQAVSFQSHAHLRKSMKIVITELTIDCVIIIHIVKLVSLIIDAYLIVSMIVAFLFFSRCALAKCTSCGM